MTQKKFTVVTNYITENQHKFYRLAYSYAGNEQDALDIVQNAICVALQNYTSIKNMNYLSTWFYRVLVNESLGFLRKKAKEQPYESDMFIENAYTEPAYEPVEDDLYREINALPEEIQIVIKLRFYEELSLKEISQITDTNLNTTKARLYRGLKALKLEVQI